MVHPSTRHFLPVSTAATHKHITNYTYLLSVMIAFPLHVKLLIAQCPPEAQPC